MDAGEGSGCTRRPIMEPRFSHLPEKLDHAINILLSEGGQAYRIVEYLHEATRSVRTANEIIARLESVPPDLRSFREDVAGRTMRLYDTINAIISSEPIL